LVTTLDASIITTTIPTILSRLHFASDYTWIGSVYTLASAAADSLWTKFSDIWGLKPIILIAVAIFANASAIAGASISMQMFIAARVLQATAKGGLKQVITIAICNLLSMQSRTLCVGLIAFIWAIARGAGPFVGGALTQNKMALVLLGQTSCLCGTLDTSTSLLGCAQKPRLAGGMAYW